MVFQTTGVYDKFTLRENLRFFGALRGIGKESLEEKAEELLHAFNLIKEADVPCSTLTESQKRRLAVACAAIHEPPILFVDESSDELDIITARLINQFITNYPTDDKTVIVATRNIVDARLVCRRMALLRNGFLVAAGTPEGLQQSMREAGLREALPELDSEET